MHLLRCMDLNSILTSDKGALPYQSAHTRIHTASLLCLACSSDPSPCADPLKGIDFGANFDDEEKEPAAESQADLIQVHHHLPGPQRPARPQEDPQGNQEGPLLQRLHR